MRPPSFSLSYMWFNCWMPYVLQKVEHREFKHVWLPLNRKYKPLGVSNDRWVNYEDFIDSAMRFESDPVKFREVWRICRPDMVSLYDDSPESRTTYFKRLESLMWKAHRFRSDFLTVQPRAASGRVLVVETASSLMSRQASAAGEEKG